MSPDSNMNPQKWLVVFLVYADFTVEKSDESKIRIEENIKIGLDQLFKDIITTRIEPELCRVYVIMDRLTFYKDEQDRFKKREQIVEFKVEKPDENDMNSLSATLFRGKDIFIEIDNKEYKNHNHDFQRELQLGGILSNIHVDEDEEILLVTWDHGSGYGIFSEETAVVEPYAMNLEKYPFISLFWEKIHKEKNEENVAFESIGEKQLKKKGQIFKCAKPGNKDEERVATLREHVDEQHSDVLSSSELSKALSIWFANPRNLQPSKKVAVLAMMNCYMMNMHSMYNFSSTVHCLVATQTGMTNPGYNIESALWEINAQQSGQPPLDAEELAKVLVEASTDQRAAIRAINMDLKPEDTIYSWALFAADLQQTKDGDNCFESYRSLIEQILGNIHALYLRNLKTPKRRERNTVLMHLLKYSRSVMYDFGQGNALIDMVNWLDLLARMDTLNPPHQRIVDADTFQLIARLKKVNQAQFADSSPMLAPLSKNFKYRADVQNIITSLPTGFGLFFPDPTLTEARWDKFNALAKADELLQRDVFIKWKELLYNGYGGAEAAPAAPAAEPVIRQNSIPAKPEDPAKQKIEVKVGEVFNLTIDLP